MKSENINEKNITAKTTAKDIFKNNRDTISHDLNEIENRTRFGSLTEWIKPKLMTQQLSINKIVPTCSNEAGCYSGETSSSSSINNNSLHQLTLRELAKNCEATDGRMNKISNYTEAVDITTVSAKPITTPGFEGFGWIRGVFIRCILCIFGATLFLRISWIAGQAGILLGTCIIFLSCAVVTITSLSMSAIATNGVVKTGGIYYMISRSLGPECGGSIGLILYIANTVNASMNCVGLAESIVLLLKESISFTIIDGAINDIRLYSLVLCLILQLIIFIGTEFENKTQLLLMLTIIISLISHFVGTFMPISTTQLQRGVVGYSLNTLMENMMPKFSIGYDFIQMFGVYFPAMTGIMAGANMSGDLRDPSKSIPIGTFLAIIVTTVIYAWCMFIPAATIVPNASGFSAPIWDDITHHYINPPCAINDTCKYGLRNDYEAMTLEGSVSGLITAGIFATTLSSASGCLIGAPRIFQALSDDELFPFIKYFAKGHGVGNDPHRAYFLTFFLACGVILIGDLNAIAALITNFFLAAFAITNFACFDASAAQSPGFRPGFRYYNKWVSLFGAILCVVIMFVLSWMTSLFTLFFFLILFFYIKNNKSHINWGSSTEANRYRRALTRLLKITRRELHVKNYRPQLLVLTGNPAARKALIDFADCITNGQNLMLCAHIIPYRSSVSSTSLIRKLNSHFTKWLRNQNIRAFYCAVASTSLREGVQALLQTVGLGIMQPNILLIGFNNKWHVQCLSDKARYIEYTGVISDAFENNMSVCVFRNEKEGLDHSAMLSNNEKHIVRLPDLVLTEKIGENLLDDLSRGIDPQPIRPRAIRPAIIERSSSNLHFSNGIIPRFNSENLESMRTENKKSSIRNLSDKFRIRIRNGVVDVWWLYDDGGMTLLLAYLLTTQNTYLPNAKMRVFTICSKPMNAKEIEENLKKLLKMFRINFTFIKVFVEDNRQLYPETINEYDELLKSLNPQDDRVSIPQEILDMTKDRTMRYLRHRELLLEYCSASSIVIITLPLATPQVVCSPVYMMWLELLSRDLPPTLFISSDIPISEKMTQLE